MCFKRQQNAYNHSHSIAHGQHTTASQTIVFWIVKREVFAKCLK